MRRVRTAWMWWVGVALLASGALACVGEVVGDDEAEQPAIEYAMLLDLEPSGEIAARVWMDAPEGCDGRLETVEMWTVHYAEGAPSLGVIVDENGDAVCVDTWSGIREELQRAMGDPSPDPMLPGLDEPRM